MTEPDHPQHARPAGNAPGPLADALDSGLFAIGSALASLRAEVRNHWQRQGRPLAIAAREKVFGVTVDPRVELNRERVVRISEQHLRRLLAGKIENSRRVQSGELHVEQDVVRLRVVLRRWRPVHAEVRFTATFGYQDEDNLELGIRRLGPTQLTSPSTLMRLFLWLRLAWARRRSEDDPLDHVLLRRAGSRREGDTIFVRIPRAPLTALAGKSQVLRRLAAYATFSSLAFRPGMLEVGFHLGRLAERMSDMYVLRHLLAEADGEDVTDPSA